MKIGSFFPLIILVVLFYALVLRPAQRRQRQAAQVSSSLEVGAEVLTTAGMMATIHAVTDSHVELEIAPGVIVRFVRGAVAKVVPPSDESDDTVDAVDAVDAVDTDHRHGLDGSVTSVDLSKPAAAGDSSSSDDPPRNTTGA